MNYAFLIPLIIPFIVNPASAFLKECYDHKTESASQQLETRGFTRIGERTFQYHDYYDTQSLKSSVGYKYEKTTGETRILAWATCNGIQKNESMEEVQFHGDWRVYNSYANQWDFSHKGTVILLKRDLTINYYGGTNLLLINLHSLNHPTYMSDDTFLTFNGENYWHRSSSLAIYLNDHGQRLDFSINGYWFVGEKLK